MSKQTDRIISLDRSLVKTMAERNRYQRALEEILAKGTFYGQESTFYVQIARVALRIQDEQTPNR